jgi:multisubunit Na+/H+ antiporter MnhC subunit
MRSRGLRFVAAVLVAAGVFLILSGGNQELARGLLIAGLLYAVMFLVIGRRRS